MSVIGIGTDIVKVSRIAKLEEKHGTAFAKRILHANEFSLYENKKNKVPYLAKRFAAKEALAKALGIGIAKGLSFDEIEVINNEDGKPSLILHGKALAYSKQIGVKKSFVSLSDEKKYAIAYVILEA